MEPFKTKLRSQLVSYAHPATLARLVYKRGARLFVFAIKLLLQLSHTENYVLVALSQKTQLVASVQRVTVQIVPLKNSARLVESLAIVRQAIFVLTVRMPTNQTSRQKPTPARVVTTVDKEHSSR